MYPADIIRILLDLLPDCRGAALTCRWWECVYRGTPDRRYWCARGTDERGTGDVRAPYVLPKMVLSTPPIWDESLTDLVMAKNIPALDAALTVLPEHICDDVVRCLITTATVHDMVPVVAYFQKLGLVEIDVACQCGSIKCFDIYDRNELSAALVSNCSKSYKTINWMIHNGYRKEAIQICTNWPGSTTKYMVREGLIPYSALRGRAQMWYHQYNEAGGEPLPPLVHVIRMWPIDGVRWYVEKMRACTHAHAHAHAHINIRALVAAVETRSVEKFMFIWRRAPVRPEGILAIAARRLRIVDVDTVEDVVELSILLGTRSLRSSCNWSCNASDGIEPYRKILESKSDIVTHIARFFTGHYTPELVSLFREYGLFVRPSHAAMSNVRSTAEFEYLLRMLARTENEPIGCSFISKTVWQIIYKGSRAATVDYLCGPPECGGCGFDRRRTDIISRIIS